ncbi:MAG TPA: transposase [Propionibacteriaceae bacterium]|nr:transposase [Propionibacteriaceae bacterium]
MADDHGRGCSGRRGGHDWRRRKLLVRADGAGASHGLLDWLTEQDAKRGRSVQYSVGFAITDQVRQAITQLPASAWQVALDADGDVREHADVAELTGLLMLPGWPQRMRVIVRREHPHPGAPLSLFEHHDGWRYQAFVTNTPVGQLALLEARHRAHARVEDRIRHAKDTGLGRLPSREYTINQAWLTCVTLAADLTAWLRLLALPEALKTCQPKALRYRLLHVPRPAHPRRAATTPPAPEDLGMGLAVLETFSRVLTIPAPG